MKTCCVEMLANERLFNIFVVILLKESNVNDYDSVATTFDLFDRFFKSIKTKERLIAGTFDYMYLLQGIKIVLKSEV